MAVLAWKLAAVEAVLSNWFAASHTRAAWLCDLMQAAAAPASDRRNWAAIRTGGAGAGCLVVEAVGCCCE